MADATPDTPLADTPLAETPLAALHARLGGKMVPFAGYSMPVQYRLGILKEHQHTRAAAGLFDVSHMGQASLSGPGAADFLESLCPGDIAGLEAGRMRYSVLLNAEGGILDDLMVLRLADNAFHLVVNAACKAEDFAHIAAHLPAGLTFTPRPELALVALQGPEAAATLATLAPGVERLDFMQSAHASIDGIDTLVTRSGYTGEDGYELSCANGDVERLAERLLAFEAVEPIGLGARDSLRLEAGLCLYGHDIDTTTSPIEAGLIWIIPKARRGAEAGYPGAARIAGEIADGVGRRRVGIRPEGRAIAREGAAILSPDGERIGVVTSGGFGPSADGPVAMGYVPPAHARAGSPLLLEVRGKRHPAAVVKLPFVPHRYYRGQ
ncbi:MAG: glycine cleavage system aminomethyltransferase GcvT [Alphaproteobacteria bacterium]|nr:glycine cleavage system aminomethyltransferase GcvT [Alphaproteobacteria bacterium]MCB9927831.1 glycine cleavage system aminomethyltransferase GcvT [Alphaproteobacteria bacterium]